MTGVTGSIPAAIREMREDRFFPGTPTAHRDEGGEVEVFDPSALDVKRTLHEAIPEIVDAPDVVTLPDGESRDITSPPPEDVAILDDWWVEGDLRRKWILTSQSEFLRRFGLPDSASAGDGVEVWHYTIEREDRVTGKRHRVQKKLTFSNGRLIRVD